MSGKGKRVFDHLWTLFIHFMLFGQKVNLGKYQLFLGNKRIGGYCPRNSSFQFLFAVHDEIGMLHACF